jgi:hypothetical protein
VSLEKWAYIAEIGSAIAVVLSLLYVAFELNQNTSAVRASNWQALLDYTASADLIVLETADVADVIVKAESNFDELTEAEKLRFGMYANNIFQSWYAAHQYYEQGVLEADTWDAIDGGTRPFLEMEAYRRFWNRNHASWGSDFNAYIDELIEQRGSP